jgi:phenylpropionate dioxygenase-like ring-hydroxylating dioxygenase large terminal subunit
MGDLMRQYWIPAVGSDELPAPDCPPLRVRLLNENLIAFRDTQGRAGLIDDYCPHRGASLFFGRNEENGLRCVYHGWKFDVTGQCTDMMSEPTDSKFVQKVKTTAYPTQERGGIVWAYMGPREVPPPLPDLEANMMAAPGAPVRRTLNYWNWLQSMENNTDTSHQAILHFGAITADVMDLPEFRDRSDIKYFIGDRAPRFHVVDTEAGVSYGASRPAGENGYYWKTQHWLFPFYTMSPVPKLGSTAQCVATVPVDDHHCMSWGMTRVVGQMDGSVRNQTVQRTPLPNTSDWLGRFRDPLSALFEKDFEIDRETQKAKPPTLQGFSGMLDVPTQDGAMQWSQGRADRGGIVDRSREHLGTTDAAIIRVRRRLLNAARSLREDGTPPPGVDNPAAYRFRSGWIVLPANVNFWEGARELREAFRREEPMKVAQVTS